MRKWIAEFLKQIRVVSLKLLELNQFAWPNYSNLLCAVPRDDVIESTRFLMRPPVSFHHGTQYDLSPRDLIPGPCHRSTWSFAIAWLGNCERMSNCTWSLQHSPYEKSRSDKITPRCKPSTTGTGVDKKIATGPTFLAKKYTKRTYQPQLEVLLEH